MGSSLGGPVLRSDTPRSSRADPATRTAVAWLGLLAALAGVEHGVGEIRQGWRTPTGLSFESWPGSIAFRVLGGEPAMSVIPNYALAGTVSIVVALVLGAWCARQMHRRHAGLVLVGLSGALLLSGGGFGPPLIGAILGATATRIGTVPRRGTGPWSVALGRPWRWALGAAVVGFLMLFPGLVVLAPLLPADGAAIVTVVSLFAFAAMGAALVSARAADRTLPGRS